MKYIKPFIAGFVSTLVFHQGLLAILHMAAIIPRAPYNMTPTPPLGVPSVLSLAFFGGLWGILIWRLIATHSPRPQFIRATLFGAIGPTFVALAVVMPIKGIEFKAIMIPIGLLLNAAWGIGLWLLITRSKS